MTASASTRSGSPTRPGEFAGLPPFVTALLLAIALLALVLLGLWSRASWRQERDQASAQLLQSARINAGLAALAVRDGRRAAEELHALLPAAARVGPDVVTAMQRELLVRLPGDAHADWLSPDLRTAYARTHDDGFDAAELQPQLSRVKGTGAVTIGSAYTRHDVLLLPLLVRRPAGDLLVVSVPLAPLLESWADTTLAEGVRVELRGADDRVLVQRAGTPSTPGSDGMVSTTSPSIAAAVAQGHRAGLIRAASTDAGGIDQLLAWSLVPGSDLRLVVGGTPASVLDAWWRNAGTKFALLATLTLLGLLATGWALGRLRGLGLAERAARIEAQRIGTVLQQALDASRDTTWRWNPLHSPLRFDKPLDALLGAGPLAPVRDVDALMAFLDDADRARLEAALAAGRDRGEPLQELLTARGADGRTRRLLLKGGPISADAADEPLQAGTLRDVTQALQLQDDLAATAETLQLMCTIAVIGPWTADPATGELRMSALARRLYGLGPDQPIAHWLHFPGAAPDHFVRLQAARRQLLATGEGYDLVLPVDTGAPAASVDDPGAEPVARRWIRSVAVAHRNAAGDIDRVDGAIQDVTPLIEAQDRLAKADRRARMLAEAVAGSSQLVLVTDAQRRITWCNEAFCKVSGFTLDEARGRNPGELLRAADLNDAAVLAAVRERLSASQPVSGLRVRNAAKSGRTYWVDLEIRPILDEQGQVEFLVGVQTDVTRDIEREAALDHAMRRFELATRNARIGVWERDLRAQTTVWNRQMWTLFGLEVRDAPPADDRMRAHLVPEDRDRPMVSFMEAARDPSRPDWQAEFRARRADGSVAWLRSQCAFERDDAGRATRAVGTLIDVTAEHDILDERAARAEAEARARAKADFLSRMSHELRTPLNAVIGYAQLISTTQGHAMPPSALSQVQRIEHAGWHLLELIDDILQLSRIEGEDVAMQVRPVDVDRAVREALTLVEPAAQQADIAIDRQLGPATAMADPTRLRQVIVNLLTNAIKYNRPGGSVRVTVQDRPTGPAVEVADTGLGFTETQLAALFEPFNRLGREHSGIPGTGIGLAIAKGLVERMGGSIQVTSRSGAGSTFRVQLAPAAPDLEDRRPGRGSGGEPRLDSAIALCVEDDEVNGQVLEQMLAHLRPGWQIERAGSVAAALEALRRRAFDVVLLDLHLPDGHGLELLQAARSEGGLRDARVIVLTADVMPEARSQAFSAAVDGFVSKPLEMDLLATALDELPF